MCLGRLRERRDRADLGHERTDTTRSVSTSDSGGFVAGVVRRGNEELAGYVSAAPDRLVALGSVPLGWPRAVDEARRCLDEHRMTGIAIGSRGGDHDLDDSVNDDLWALLAERTAFVFLHPAASACSSRLAESPVGRRRTETVSTGGADSLPTS